MAEEITAEMSIKPYTGTEEPIRPAAVKPAIVAKLVPKEEVPEAPEEPIDELVEAGYYPPDTEYKSYTHLPPSKRPVVIDIETTAANPWEGRLICISAKDATREGTEIMTFYNEKEEIALLEFLDWYQKNIFDEVIGYNVSFDFRWLFVTCMRYRLSSPQFFNSELYDMANVMQQVKREFVFGFNKSGGLGDWMEYLYGVRKSMTHEDIFAAWDRKDVDAIIKYNKEDVFYTYEMWALAQQVLGKA